MPETDPQGAFPVLSGIPPAHLCREHSTFKLALQAQLNTNPPLHALVRSAQFLGTQRLHSRRSFRRHAAALINSGFNILEHGRPQKFFQGGQRRHFAYTVLSGCCRCNANGLSQNTFPFLPGLYPGFKVWGAEHILEGHDFQNYMFINILLGKKQFGNTQKYLGWHCPRMPPRGYRADSTPQKRHLLRLITKMRFFGGSSQVH